MSFNLSDVLPVAQTALQSFLQTLLGSASPLSLKAPEETDVDAVRADCQDRLVVLGRANDITTFVVALDEAWLPLLSQAMLGEAMAATDEGADDLLRELAAQGYGAVRNALSGEDIKLPEVTYLVSLPEEALADNLFPSSLRKIPFDLAQDAGPIAGFALIPPPSAPPPSDAEDAEDAKPTADAKPAEKQRPVPVSPAAFPSLGGEQFKGDPRNPNFNLLAEVELEITVELGRRQLPLSDVLNLTNGSVIELEKLVGEPLQIFANGRLIAEGEAVVIDEQFGVRVTALASTRQRAKAFL